VIASAIFVDTVTSGAQLALEVMLAPPARPIRVLIADDHEIVRVGIGRLLETMPDIEVVGLACDGEEAIALSADRAPDVVLMDLQMPQVSGIEATHGIVEAFPPARVLMLTISGQERDVLDAMLAGACGYLVKGTAPEGLVAGIRAAAAGDALLSPGIARKLLGRARESMNGAESSVPSPTSTLSERELEVLKLLARGKPNAEIARELYLSPHTVRNHISNILSKLQIANRTEATALAIRSGLV
jgi:DNA-binding NarL/FixJ family response regulator